MTIFYFLFIGFIAFDRFPICLWFWGILQSMKFLISMIVIELFVFFYGSLPVYAIHLWGL